MEKTAGTTLSVIARITWFNIRAWKRTYHIVITISVGCMNTVIVLLGTQQH
jgi:hypothetical protein